MPVPTATNVFDLVALRCRPGEWHAPTDFMPMLPNFTRFPLLPGFPQPAAFAPPAAKTSGMIGRQILERWLNDATRS